MKQIVSILAFMIATLTISAQSLITVTKTKIYDEYGGQLSTTTSTVLISRDNISTVSGSGSGSIIMLKSPQKLDGNTVTGYSVTNTPDQINTLVNSVIGANLSNNVTYAKPVIRNCSSTSYTASATVSTSELLSGLLTITSGTCTLTLPTASQLATALNASAGTSFDFSLLNVASGGTATIAVGTGITASGFPGTNTLTLANSATVGVATFRIHFISSTAATLTRIN